jgi:hypothetical protein
VVKFYHTGGTVTEKTTDVQDLKGDSKNFILSYDAGSETISGIELHVKYSDDKSFTKEIL